jgi:hypothetical protein
MTIRRFLIAIEKANGNYSAYSPDLQGCVATGKTKEREDKGAGSEKHARGY